MQYCYPISGHYISCHLCQEQQPGGGEVPAGQQSQDLLQGVQRDAPAHGRGQQPRADCHPPAPKQQEALFIPTELKELWYSMIWGDFARQHIKRLNYFFCNPLNRIPKI